MSFEVILLPELVDDLEEIFLWYEEQSEGLSLDLEEEFYRRLNDIQNNPFGFQIRYASIRIAWLKRFPYGIHFYCEGNCIFATALIHTSRSPEIWLDRLNP